MFLGKHSSLVAVNSVLKECIYSVQVSAKAAKEEWKITVRFCHHHETGFLPSRKDA